MLTKSAPWKVKATSDDGLEPGQFEGLVSVFGNVDSYGEMVMPGAFTDTLKAWEDSGHPIPVIWSHQWQDPNAHIGTVLKAEERPDGLWVKGQLDLEAPGRAGEMATQVNRLMKGRRVTQASFAYDVVDAGMAKADGESVFELRKLDLFEVGPCLVGVNQETSLTAKSIVAVLHRASAELKAGRVLSASNESALKAALDSISSGVTSIQEVLAAASDAGKSSATVANPEAWQGKGDERPGITPADVKMFAMLDEALSELG